MTRFNTLDKLKNGGKVLLNTKLTEKEIDELPNDFKKTLIEKRAQFYIIDAQKIASENNLGNKINTVMQSAFFHLTKIIDYEKYVEKAKEFIEKTYSRKGEQVVKNNINALNVLSNITEIDIQKLSFEDEKVEKQDNDIVKLISERKGNEISVSKLSLDGGI